VADAAVQDVDHHVVGARGAALANSSLRNGAEALFTAYPTAGRPFGRASGG